MNSQAADKPDSQLATAGSPAVIAHLNMLQAIIARLAGNSAQCKTWCVAIISALFGLAGATKSRSIAETAIIPILVFGFVDAAYLANEKAYRDLYNAIAAKIRGRSYGLADFANLSGPHRCRPLYLGIRFMVSLADLYWSFCFISHRLAVWPAGIAAFSKRRPPRRNQNRALAAQLRAG